MSKIFSLGVHMVPLGVHLDTQVALKKCPDVRYTCHAGTEQASAVDISAIFG
jgi:hypothetical protein